MERLRNLAIGGWAAAALWATADAIIAAADHSVFSMLVNLSGAVVAGGFAIAAAKAKA